ncbi:MAG: hypothetical protein DRP01_05120 [Archaeoglobales archaeon]|nr:MAG: hypothetical protein DRP01_05120 [Archaeoglobales archaeon]
MDIGRIVMIVFFALGMFVLPSTLSLFSGQHFWYNTKQNGSNVPCEKCHADVMDKMEAIVAPHTGETGYGKM